VGLSGASEVLEYLEYPISSPINAYLSAINSDEELDCDFEFQQEAKRLKTQANVGKKPEVIKTQDFYKDPIIHINPSNSLDHLKKFD
jgi:hypothetical protein